MLAGLILVSASMCSARTQKNRPNTVNIIRVEDDVEEFEHHFEYTIFSSHFEK